MIKEASNVVKLARKPRASDLMKIIRQKAIERDIDFSKHAFDRTGQRAITTEDAYYVLECGSIEGDVTKGKFENEWATLVTFRAKGSRKIGVATVVVCDDEEVLVPTVMWCDR